MPHQPHDQHSNSAGSPKRRIKELVSKTIHGHLEEHPSLKAVVEWFQKEGKGVKHGWVLFSVLALALMVVAGRGTHWVDQKLYDSEMSATNTIHSSKVDGLNEKIEQLKSDKA